MIPSSAKQEIKEIDNYRIKANNTDSFGVLYTQEQIFEYVKPGGIFDQIKSKKPAIAKDNIWSVGFLFKKTLVAGVEKLSFAVVPLEFDTKNNQVKDRIDGKFYLTHGQVLPISADKSVEDFLNDEDEDFANTGNIFP